jgi:aryl-alcohol dehydrogenase-like predicted oxidoreductase
MRRRLDHAFANQSDAIAAAPGFTLRRGVRTAIVGTTSIEHVKSNMRIAQAPDEFEPRHQSRDRRRQAASADWVGQDKCFQLT